eukprot:TRINITY_DN3005_c0_g1_i1.p1 TRINITY_DN3005_c0_g1~~TRINITY_DN3005_c0_g1_i1.p1  ORF type:complete len:864 (-),score=66.54 TRINITY_DN3005_c0_g1_i1:13521-16112(-)
MDLNTKMSMRENVFTALAAATCTKVPIKAVFKVKCLLGCLDTTSVYLAFSNECFLILSKFLDEIVEWSPVYYADIQYVVKSSSHPHQLLFQLVNHTKKYPASIIPLYAISSKLLLRTLKVLWTTDSMARTATYVKYPRIKRPFAHPSFADIKNPEPEPNDEFKVGNFKEVTFRGYKLIIPEELKDDPFAEGCYKKRIRSEINGCKYRMENTLGLEVSELIPSSVLSEGRLADNIKYVCEKYGLQTLADYGCKEGYKFEYSGEFPKVLKTDLAKWEAWETLIFGASMACSVIVMRRAYIPPLMDSYQYLIFFSVVKYRIRPPRLRSPVNEEELKSSSDGALKLQPVILELFETFKQVASSVVPSEICSKRYKRIIGLRKKAMYLHFDEVKHLEQIEEREKQEREGNIPKGFPTPVEGIGPDLYVASVLNYMHKAILNIAKSKDSLAKEVPALEQQHSVFMKLGGQSKQSVIVPSSKLEQIEAYLKEILDKLGYIIRTEHEKPEAIVKVLESSGFYSNLPMNREYHLAWKEKVANYLAAKLECVGNGIQVVSEITTSILGKAKRPVGEGVLHYLLHLREKGDTFLPKIPFGEGLKNFALNHTGYEYNKSVFPYLLENGIVANTCNRMNHLLYPELAYKLLTTSENFAIMSAVLTHLNGLSFDKLLLSCGKSRSEVEDAYLRLLKPCINLLYSGNEELLVQATNLTLKLMRFKVANDTDIWKFEFHSIVARNLYRTGRPQVACATLRLLAFLLSIESMPFVLSDPKLQLSDSIQELCKDVRDRPRHYTGEDIYRLLILCYVIGTRGASKERALISTVANYAEILATYENSQYAKSIQLVAELFSKQLNKKTEQSRIKAIASEFYQF